MVKLRAKLYKVALVRWVDVPKAAVAPLALTPADIKGAIKGWNALLRFNDDLDRVTLFASSKRGHFKFAFKVELLKAAGVDAGDTVEFTLERDTASREPDLPEEMARTFRTRPELRERWQAHSVAMRRQVVRYIEQAKSSEVRAKRCWIFLERLAETGKLGG
ncbi:YdeI/OmpD-associated family protein [Opitutus sp. GAS368]|uniref:YdeI/OmpD-associated family protein n=1 Tax=Opitutus sp. GAS368 TaxID=1882749 RepID=UPI00087C8AB5|nr:YdeI/OmpD-associated family protein [Opitutus sp. GAS368]SDR92333.1 Bacteriocin-protection, YdeI or OmpD-Associated [Opitutus sp. GAS368]